MARRATRQEVKPVARPAPATTRGKPAKAGGKADSKAGSKVETKAAPRAATLVSKPNLEGITADQKVSALLRDRDKLVARLQAAEARVAELEARQEDLTDRIAWALDTLKDLLRLPDAP